MAKKKVKKEVPIKAAEVKPEVKKGFWNNKKLHRFVVFCAAFLLYANTLTHDYTQDDAIVIYDNMFTQKGISGIPGLLTNDTFFGFFKVEGKAKLVSGGRYRPLTPIMFAMEWQLFGRNPFMGHLISIILFGLLCLLLYSTLDLVLIQNDKYQYSRALVLIATLLFVVHPIHTEVVANIKGRDEIMSLMGALCALYCSFKFYYTKNFKWIFLSALSFFLGLMSKENTITYLAVVPIAFLLFTKSKFSKAIFSLTPVVLATIVFIIIRTAVLGFDFGAAPNEMMNNPFIKVDGNRFVSFTGLEKIATILFTLGKYIQLLIFPHPLTHDYYPRHIEIMNFGNIKVLLSLLSYIGLVFSVFFFWKRNKIISFSIFYFLATLSIVSNVVFPIGTNMSERFMFMPSIGYALMVAYFFDRLFKNQNTRMISFAFIAVLLVGYSLKTFTRNFIWKNDYTLFTTDVETSRRSAKVLNAAGGAIYTEFANQADSAERTKQLQKAKKYLKEAIGIHPRYKNAFLLLGNTEFSLKQYTEAIRNYDYALEIDPNYTEIIKNYPIILQAAGRYYGEEKQDFVKAEQYLKRSYGMNPKSEETVRLLGISAGLQGKHKEAIKYFNELITINPKNASAYASLGTAYMNMGDDENARIFFQKATEINPQILNQIRKK